MEEGLPIVPFRQALEGEVILPGSKSITNRVLVLAALSEGTVTIHNASFCEDSLIMVEALRALGFSIHLEPEDFRIVVNGRGGLIPNAEAKIDVGNAGTVARFLTAVVSLHPGGSYYMDGSVAMRGRPMLDLLEPLQALGAVRVIYHEEYGHFPFTLKTYGFSGGEMVVDVSKSSQMLSALLLIAPIAVKSSVIFLKRGSVDLPFIRMTLGMMMEFGQHYLREGCFFNGGYHFLGNTPYDLASGDYFVEPDITAGSYFFALTAIIGGELKFPGLKGGVMLQGDEYFCNVLTDQGLVVEKADDFWVVRSGGLHSLENSLEFREINFNAFSDTFLTYAAIVPLFKKVVCIQGIGHTRYQECDRISAVVRELRKLNQDVLENEDAITIYPKDLIPASIETYGDHRIAMSFAVLGSYDLLGNGEPWVVIRDPSCCRKTFPNFFSVLSDLKCCRMKKSLSLG